MDAAQRAAKTENSKAALTNLKYRPASSGGEIVPPAWLTPEELIHFGSLVDMLRAAGTLDAIDVHGIGRLVRYRSMWEGCLDPTELIKLENHIMRLEKQFGLSPNARKNVVRNSKAKQTSEDGRKNRYFGA